MCVVGSCESEATLSDQGVRENPEVPPIEPGVDLPSDPSQEAPAEGEMESSEPAGIESSDSGNLPPTVEQETNVVDSNEVLRPVIFICILKNL